MISVLCANAKSNYKNIDGFDVWDVSRNAYNFNGSNPVITHAPCAQWSSLKGLSTFNLEQKDLAWFCYQKVKANGGIFEHPAHSSFFKQAGVNMKQVISIDQFWYGYYCHKRTWLYFSKCKPLSVPLRFEYAPRQLNNLTHAQRAETTIQLATWLMKSIHAAGIGID